VHPMPQEKTFDLSLKETNFTTEDFHIIFIRYSKPILSFIYSMIQDRSQAEELCQETFMRALMKLKNKDENASLSTWLFGIAHNVIREAVKRKYRILHTAAPLDPLTEKIISTATRPDQQLIAAELNSRIQDALQTLKESQRMVFILKIIHKLKYEEIAAITGTSISKIKTDLHRARLEMRQKLHSYLSGNSIETRGGM
jgi:RNA polymerase sigma-70 factor, ECF subfamily